MTEQELIEQIRRDIDTMVVTRYKAIHQVDVDTQTAQHIMNRVKQAGYVKLKDEIKQARAEERQKVLDDIQAGAVSVGDLVEAALQEVAGAIFESLEKGSCPHFMEVRNCGLCYKALKDKYLKGGK